MKRSIFAVMLALLLALCGCRGPEPPVNPNGPGRMVRRIEVALHPADASFDRTYVTQDNMNGLLSLLRSMQTDQAPEQEPDIEGGQSFYTVTVTFANGQQSVYYLLGHTYLRMGDAPWCVIGSEQAMQFNEFIRNHPTDDGSVIIETTVPAETAAPTE